MSDQRHKVDLADELRAEATSAAEIGSRLYAAKLREWADRVEDLQDERMLFYDSLVRIAGLVEMAGFDPRTEETYH